MESRTTNRFVSYLNTLRTQADSGNAFCFHEARGQPETLKQFGLTPEETRVPTRLDALVEGALRPDFPFRVIIITGDAGDGKTACCERLAERLYGGPLPAELRTRSRLDGPPFGDWVILKDGSELNHQSDPQLNIDQIVAEELPAQKQRFVVAINEGRLRRSCQRAEGQRLWLSVVEDALAAREGTPQQVELANRKMLESKVLLLNLRDRCLPADRSTFNNLLDTFTARARWEQGACQQCPAQVGCHIYANAVSLRASATREQVRKMLLAAYDAGQALPYRRVQGLIAYGITGGFQCSSATGAPSILSGDYNAERAFRARYYNTLLGVAPTPHDSTRPEPISRFLQRADPAVLAAPECDRLLSGAPSLQELHATFSSGWTQIEQSVSVQPRTKDQRALLARSLKRKAFFELTASAPLDGKLGAALARFSSRFPFESFGIYDQAISATGSGSNEAMREAERLILRGLNGLELGSAGGDVLRQEQLDPHELVRGVKYGLTFGLVVEPRSRVDRLPEPPNCSALYLEHRSPALVLVAAHGQQEVRLRVDLGLFELLNAVAHGFRAPQAFGTYLLDVQRFKERLIRTFGAELGGRTTLAFGRGSQRYRFRFEPGKQDTAFDLERM